MNDDNGLMRAGLPDDYGIQKLQSKILETQKLIHDICEINHIDYYIMGGTALGAVRHGGFIPWDDDLDIFMTPSNYSEFRKAVKKYNSKLYLQEWGKIDDKVTMAKVRMNGTTYIEPDVKKWRMHQGIYVDIFILHSAPKSSLLRWRQCLWAKFLKMKGLAEFKNGRQKGMLKLAIDIVSILPENFLKRHAMNCVYQYDKDDNTEYVCHYLGHAMMKEGTYKRDLFGTPTKVQFETVQLYGPSKIEEYLVKRFGDYHKIPSKDEIRWTQHADIWDADKDYTEYTHTTDFRDEAKLI
ncbi:UNVERIFIED_CONTAM: LicD family protein [Bacteroidetes bacterium 56_B9]